MSLTLLCIKIFFARICDVTLGTLRTIFTVKGKTIIAGIIAFIEVFIWFLVAKEALNTDVSSIFIVISYAGGYATGTILGTFISKKFINSLISVEVITTKANKNNIAKIREEGFGVSVVNTIENYNNNSSNISSFFCRQIFIASIVCSFVPLGQAMYGFLLNLILNFSFIT